MQDDSSLKAFSMSTVLQTFGSLDDNAKWLVISSDLSTAYVADPYKLLAVDLE